jgi:hypothetical protein
LKNQFYHKKENESMSTSMSAVFKMILEAIEVKKQMARPSFAMTLSESSVLMKN